MEGHSFLLFLVLLFFLLFFLLVLLHFFLIPSKETEVKRIFVWRLNRKCINVVFRPALPPPLPLLVPLHPVCM